MRVGKSPLWGYGFILGAAVLAGICVAIVDSFQSCHRQTATIEKVAP